MKGNKVLIVMVVLVMCVFTFLQMGYALRQEPGAQNSGSKADAEDAVEEGGGPLSSNTLAYDDVLKQGQDFTVAGRGLESYEGVDSLISTTDQSRLLTNLALTGIVNSEGTRAEETSPYDFSPRTVQTVLFTDEFVKNDPEMFERMFRGYERDGKIVVIISASGDVKETKLADALKEAGLLEEANSRRNLIVLGVQPGSIAAKGFENVFGLEGFVDLSQRFETTDDMLNNKDLMDGLGGAV